MIKVDMSFFSTVIISIVGGILGYFVYDCSINAALAVIAISIAIDVVITLLSLIPILGWIISIILCYIYVIPFMLTLMNIEWTWLITGIFVLSALRGFIITIIIGFIIIAAINDF